MSLPLTRRIAKTVLLTAAGAASVVGTAGAASAAELPTTTNVGGLSHPDNSVGSAAAQGVKKLNPMSSSPVSTASGVAANGVKAAGSDTDKVAPATRKFAGDSIDGASEGLQKQTPNLQQNVPNVQRNVPSVQTQGLPANSVSNAPAQRPSAQSTPGQQIKGVPGQVAQTGKARSGGLLGGIVSLGR